MAFTNGKKKRKMSVFLHFPIHLCTVFILHKNQLTVGDLDYSILIDQDKVEKCFLRAFSQKMVLFLIIDLLSKSASRPTSRPASKRYTVHLIKYQIN